VGAKLAISIANGVRLEHINEYKDSIRQARANPPSQSSSSASASSSSAGPARLGKQAIIDAALKDEKWRLKPALRRAQRDDRSVTMEDVKKVANRALQPREAPAKVQLLGSQPCIRGVPSGPVLFRRPEATRKHQRASSRSRRTV
ncbi:MAG: hypothetical protein ACKPKO_50880, partial [Candidatus Fonsibacter sp.]